jgi:hypothetical protein
VQRLQCLCVFCVVRESRIVGPENLLSGRLMSSQQLVQIAGTVAFEGCISLGGKGSFGRALGFATKTLHMYVR